MITLNIAYGLWIAPAVFTALVIVALYFFKSPVQPDTSTFGKAIAGLIELLALCVGAIAVLIAWLVWALLR